MKILEFSIAISASKERVWSVLWDDHTFRDWANYIDEGTYLQGELIEGNQVQFISSVNGYGVTSLVSKLIPNEYVLFKHQLDTKDMGSSSREKQWTGGFESYTLNEQWGETILTIKSEVPEELVDLFSVTMPTACHRIKEIAEEIKP